MRSKELLRRSRSAAWWSLLGVVAAVAAGFAFGTWLGTGPSPGQGDQDALPESGTGVWIVRSDDAVESGPALDRGAAEDVDPDLVATLDAVAEDGRRSQRVVMGSEDAVRFCQRLLDEARVACGEAFTWSGTPLRAIGVTTYERAQTAAGFLVAVQLPDDAADAPVLDRSAVQARLPLLAAALERADRDALPAVVVGNGTRTFNAVCLGIRPLGAECASPFLWQGGRFMLVGVGEPLEGLEIPSLVPPSILVERLNGSAGAAVVLDANETYARLPALGRGLDEALHANTTRVVVAQGQADVDTFCAELRAWKAIDCFTGQISWRGQSFALRGAV